MPRIPRLGAAGLAIVALTLTACARSVPAREPPPSLATPTSQPGVVGTPAASPTPGAPATPAPEEETNQVVGTIHVVQEGDSLFSLANRYSVSVQAIMDANGISDPNIKLSAGSTLIIPIETATTEQTSATTSTTAPETYAVQPGDTLVTIAQRFGVTVEALIAANELANPEMLSIGQVLTLPDGAGDSGASSNSAVVTSSLGTTYTVQPGDTLWSIAQAYGTTQAAILAANNLESSTQLQAGRVLTIPNEQNLGK